VLDKREIEQAAVRLLASREHTLVELRRKLAAKVQDGELLEQVLAGLQAQRLQSDERFVEQYIESRRRKGYGPVRIRHELQQRGVDAELIEAWLDEADDGWRALVQDVCRRKFGSARPSDFKARARQARFLEYRGFPVELIREVIWSE